MNCFFGRNLQFCEHITYFSPIKLVAGLSKEGDIFESNKLGIHTPVEDCPKKYAVFEQLSSWLGDNNMKGRQHGAEGGKKLNGKLRILVFALGHRFFTCNMRKLD